MRGIYYFGHCTRHVTHTTFNQVLIKHSALTCHVLNEVACSASGVCLSIIFTCFDHSHRYATFELNHRYQRHWHEFSKPLYCILQLLRSSHTRGHEAATVFLAVVKRLVLQRQTCSRDMWREIQRHETGRDKMSSIFTVALLVQTVPVTPYFYASMCVFFSFVPACVLLTQTVTQGPVPSYVLAACLLVCPDLYYGYDRCNRFDRCRRSWAIFRTAGFTFPYQTEKIPGRSCYDFPSSN